VKGFPSPFLKEERMQLKYGHEDRPPFKEIIIYGMQWFAVTVPAVIILGKILGGMQGGPESGMLYMQKLLALMSLSLLVQIWRGHRLPLVIGPATVLLIGILASQDSPPAAVYSTILICGVVLTLLGVSGFFTKIRNLFTPRVVAVILLLVAFTMMPAIVSMISGSSGRCSSVHNLSFAFVFILIMFGAQRVLEGLWNSTLILWGMVIGSLVYFLINPDWIEIAGTAQFELTGHFFHNLTGSVVFDPGLIIAFLLCFVGLAINDLGSIQAVGSVLQAEDMPARITRGVSFTGVSNIIAGFLGVIGPLNYSFSPGVIAATGCAARITLVPAGIIMLVLSFMPGALVCLSFIPSVVIGAILLYIMCSQVAAGLITAVSDMEEPDFDYLLIIAFPVLAGVTIAFLPDEVTSTFPSGLKPILANGFVVGVLVSLLFEHLIFRNSKKKDRIES